MRIGIVGHRLNRLGIANLRGQKNEPAEVERRGPAHIRSRRPFQHRRYVALLLIRVETLDIPLVPSVLGVAVPAIGPRVGRRDDLIFFDFQEIHRGFGLGVDVFPLLHHLLELPPDLGRELGAVLEVVVHQAEDRMLVALGVDGVELTLDPAKMILHELLVYDLRQPVVIVFHLDRALAVLDRREAKRERARLIVSVVVEERLVQAHHLQEVAAVHDVLLDVRIDPAVPVVFGFVDHDLSARLGFGAVGEVELARVCPVVPHVFVDHPLDQACRRLLVEIAVGRRVVVVGAGQCVGGECDLELVRVETHVVDGVGLAHQGKIAIELVRQVDHMANVAHLLGRERGIARRIRIGGQPCDGNGEKRCTDPHGHDSRPQQHMAPS